MSGHRPGSGGAVLGSVDHDHDHDHDHDEADANSVRQSGRGALGGAGGNDDDERGGFGVLFFSHNVSQVLVGAEELRRSVSACDGAGGAEAAGVAVAGGGRPPAATVTTSDVVRWKDELDNLCRGLDVLWERFVVSAPRGGTTQEEALPTRDVARDLHASCHQKVREVARQAFHAALRMSEPPPRSGDDRDETGGGGDGQDTTDVDLQREGQAAVARIMELLLGLLHVNPPPRNPSLSEAGDVPAAETTTTAAAADSAAVVQSYVQYQRQVLRQRAKPCVADLVQARNKYRQANDEWERLRIAAARSHQQPGSSSTSFRVLAVDDDPDDPDAALGTTTNGTVAANGGNPAWGAATSAAPSASTIHHAASIATLLGLAAQLIHPLLAWRNHLDWELSHRPPLNDNHPDEVAAVPTRYLRDACTQASRIVHEQAINLVETVAAWMAEDHRIDEWMEVAARADSAAEGVSASSSLHGLDGLVEELAYSCHVVKRYLVLVEGILPVIVDGGPDSSPSASASDQQPGPLDTLLHEWTYKYAALERHLAVQNWRAALEVAQPTALVLGTSIRVPSFVEDAHYLSMRALQRAAGTAQSALAVGTVAHALSHDVWSTDDPVPPHSICEALTNRHGCWHDATTSPAKVADPSSAPKSGDFASAFLEALDQDAGRNDDGATSSLPVRSKPMGSAPASGNFLSLIGLDAADARDGAAHLDAEHCMLNGIHAAATACRELAAFLDSLLGAAAAAAASSPDHDDGGREGGDPFPPLEMDAKSLAMIQLAHDDLVRSSHSYAAWLHRQVEDHIQSNSQCLALLRDFFVHENYELSAADMKMAESDDRLQRDMMAPLTTSRFLSRLSDTLDSEVCRIAGDEIVRVMVEKVILKVLWAPVEGEGSGNVSESAGDDEDPPKRFTELGALLLSKQVRMLQGFAIRIASNPEFGAPASTQGSAAAAASGSTVLPNYAQWERLSQVLTALQLEKPSDWLSYRYQSTSTLTPDELRQTLRLRADFRRDAIQAVVHQVVQACAASTTSSAAAAAAVPSSLS